MQQRQVSLFEAPKDILFTLKDITYTPETPRKGVPFTVKGKVELFGIPFLAPIWVIAKVTAPETWWEHYIPIWGSPTKDEGQMALGGDFEIIFPRGFDREGEFLLDVEVHPGPTYTIDKITLPPFPPVAKEEMTFIVAGEVPPEEAGFRNFRILSYSKNGGTLVTPPGVLELDTGDRCRVNVGFDHRNGAVTGKLHAAIWQERLWDPHDEILNAEKTFNVPSSPDWMPVEDSVDIIITSAISPDSEYGLYVKIMGITGGDIFTEYLANVITIIGVPPEEADIKDFDFKLTKGTYDIGARVPFTAPYDYKGIAQDGQLTISMGTGVYPSFNPVYTYEPIPVEFPAAGDWETRGLEGNITLPDVLEPGQTYSIRAKLETLEIKTQETDTDWSAFDITPVVPPTSDIRNFDFQPQGGNYDLGDSVPYAAPYDYKGKAQGGWLTISLGTGIYPSFFTKHTFPRIAASFDEAFDWAPGYLPGSLTLPTTLELGQTYSVRAKLETADGKQETDTDWGILTIREIAAFSLSKPSAYPYSAPPGPVLITCPVTLLSSQSVTAQVRCIVYEGSALPGHGTKLWESTKTITISPNETENVKFMRTSVVGTIDRRDVEVEVYIAGRLVKESEWDDVYYVEPPTVAVSFSARPWGITPDSPNPKSWTCYYWDPGRNDFIGDGNWHNLPDTRQFKDVQLGGFLAAFYLDYSGAVSQQYTSEVFNPIDGATYQFELATGRVYRV